MNKSKAVVSVLALLSIVLASLLIVGYKKEQAAALSYTIGSPVMSQSAMPMGMVLKTFNVPATEPVPTIAFDVTRDSMGDGWTVHVTTTNFQFTPENLNMAPVAGDGHVHLYIDNELIVMLSPWYHIDTLTPGTHTLKVSLNNNDHSIYALNGTDITAQKTLIVQ